MAYTKTFAALIPEWRRTFRDAQMPFDIIQMVSWGFPPKLEETEVAMVSNAPHIREAQLKAHVAHPDTGFVVAYDLGHIQMHSPFKTPLGERMARWALATQYDRSVNYKTPIYQSMKIDGNRITVSFDEPPMNISKIIPHVVLLIGVNAYANDDSPIDMAKILDEGTLATEVIRDWHAVDGPCPTRQKHITVRVVELWRPSVKETEK